MGIKTVCLDYGHCLQGADTGARSQYGKEEELTRLVGRKIRSILTSQGIQVIETVYNNTFNSVKDSLNHRCNVANQYNVDLFISIHFNCYNRQAYGTEVFTNNGAKLPIAERILNSIVSLGFANRGIKDGKNLAVIRNTRMESMLIECCFIDNKEDMAKFNVDTMALAIAEGILGRKITVSADKEIHNVNINNTTNKSNVSNNKGLDTQAIIQQLYNITCSLNQYASTHTDNKEILNNIKALQGVMDYIKSNK